MTQPLPPSPTTRWLWSALRFEDPQVEERFQRYHDETALPLIRRTLVYGGLILSAYMLVGEELSFGWDLFGLGIAGLVLMMALTFTRAFLLHLQSLMSAMVLAVGALLVSLETIAGDAGPPIYFPALFMLITFSYTLLNLRFRWTLLACWPVIGLELILAVIKGASGLTLLYTFFLLATALLGSFGSYHYERYKRQNFQQSHTNREKVAEIRRLNRRLRELSVRDPLTGLYNRRELEHRIEEALAVFHRYQTPATVLLLDLDDFKTINDTYGHPVGDRVLMRVSRALLASTRETDQVFRYGGDEFLVLLHNTPAHEARACWGRLRRALREMEIPVAFSGGATALHEGHRTADEVLKEIDASLYEVKRNQKGRVLVSINTDDDSPKQQLLT